MKKIIVATIAAASALAGAAQAGAAASNYEFLQAARCRGLAASDGLGKVDTAGIDAFLRTEGASRELPVRASAQRKIVDAQKEGDKADGAKKEKLLAERTNTCSAWLNGASTGAAVNTAN
ncbi:MAG: hypothetical protein J7515_10510 [Caulobacter sp.]|nr:hypothetical protein [Caulobacter sp.]